MEKRKLQTAVIGVGNMGSKYAALILNGSIQGLELAAMTRIGKPYREQLLSLIGEGVTVYEDADRLFDDFEKGLLDLDAVIIATPHYSHEKIAVRAFRGGLHVLSDKPAGVYSRQARHMDEAADLAGKTYAMVFNQRTMPIYQTLREIVASGKYGSIKRVNWIVTDWYRPDPYYSASSWHASWAKDGGGILLNQCPHNLDILQWICGMPARVQGFCIEGHFHDIEVEDDVTVYMEWPNGATGTFISSTGDAPGMNRLEISLEEAMLVCENGRIRIGELYDEMGMKEADYRKTSSDFFRKIHGTWTEILPPKEDSAYALVLQAFADECLGMGKSVAEGSEGRKGLLISNAIYLSSWKKHMVEIPEVGSADEKAFEEEFEEWLKRKGGLVSS